MDVDLNFQKKRYIRDIIVCTSSCLKYIFEMVDMNQTQSELLKILDGHDLLRPHHLDKTSGINSMNYTATYYISFRCGGVYIFLLVLLDILHSIPQPIGIAPLCQSLQGSQ